MIEGMEDLQNQIKALPEKLQNKALRPAVTAASRYLAKAAKTIAPVESGLLKKSMGQKVKQYGPMKVTGIVGPRNTPSEYKGRLRNPAHYAHLVERGHLGPHPAPPHPFLRPALDANKPAIALIIKTFCASALNRL